MSPQERARRRWGLPLLAIALALAALYLLVELLFPFVLSLLIGGIVYYLFAPVVDLLERRGVPRLASTAAAVCVVLGGLAGAVLFLVPPVYGQLDELARELPAHGERFEEWLVEAGVVDEENGGRQALDPLVERGDELALGVVEQVLGALAGVAGAFFALVFGLVIGFYLLQGAPSLSASLYEWTPPERRDRWARFGRQASAVLAGYLRARLIASLFVGTAYGIAFALLGLPDALLLGVAGGVLNLVPVVGPLLAAVPALLVAAFQGWPTVAAVLVVMVVAQQIESSVIGPHLEGRFVRLHPAVIVIVAAAGAALAGIIGLLLAPPVAGVVRAALETFYRESWLDPQPPARTEAEREAAPAGTDGGHDEPG